MANLPEWRVVITDDEPAARRGVRQLLAPHARFRVVGECRNGRELLDALDTLRPHVVFLDIQMPDMSGFDVIAERSAERMPIVVFLTAFDQHAIRAFDAQALDYLVKPVSQARFDESIKRIARQLERGTPALPITLSVPTARGVRVIALPDIQWIEAADNYARIWVEGRDYLLRQSLEQLEEELQPLGFVRVHRNALVPVVRIKRLRRHTDGQMVAVLDSDVSIPVSRRRRGAVHQAIAQRSLGGSD